MRIWIFQGACVLLVSILASCSHSNAGMGSDAPPLRQVEAIQPESLSELSAMKQLLAPYRAEVAKWEEVIGRTSVEMPISRRRYELGSWIADAMRLEGSQAVGREIDATFTNSGGIRATLPEGEVTFRTISEILPFENHLVLYELDAAQMKRLGEHLAASRGWNPVSNMRVYADAEGNLQKLLVNGEPVREAETYLVGTNSFLSTGAGGFEFLADWDGQQTEHLLRDLVADYVRTLDEEGETIEVPGDWERYYIGGEVAE